MKSLSSSRREVLVDCFHVYTYHISYLLPGSAVLQHSAAAIHYFGCHGQEWLSVTIDWVDSYSFFSLTKLPLLLYIF